MTAFVLKMIALTAMIIDHIGAAFPGYAPFEFRIIGRLTFPIFVFLLAEGFRHTRSPMKFLLRLFAFAIISEPFFDWAITRTHLTYGYNPWRVDFLNNTNIFYTLFLGGVAIVAFQWIARYLTQRFSGDSPEEPVIPHHYSTHLPQRVAIYSFAALPTIGFMWIAEILGTDYGGYGVLFIFLMYVIKSPKWLVLMVLTVMNVFQHRGLWPFFIGEIPIPIGFYLMIPATLLTVPLIAMYNQQRGPSLKWLFYIVYPAHLAVLAGLAFLF